jgi:hypothetical protein
VTGYDVKRLTPGGSVTTHHDGAVHTDGPWLILYAADLNRDAPVAVYPAHAVYAVERCEGVCRDGRE